MTTTEKFPSHRVMIDHLACTLEDTAREYESEAQILEDRYGEDMRLAVQERYDALLGLADTLSTLADYCEAADSLWSEVEETESSLPLEEGDG